jgi:hypothetical protein
MKNILFFLIVITFFSCEKDQDIGTILIPYQIKYEVETFISEGEKRGINIDLKGLRFYLRGNLVNNWQGYYDGNEHAIYLDTTCLSYIQEKEALIFHEMGHAILNREHKLDTLPNGDPSSIMGTPVPIYTGLSFTKRQYYIDELFNQNTPIPSWSL